MKDHSRSATAGKVRVAVLQRVCPAYRVRLFQELTASDQIDALLVIGEDPPGKLKSAARLDGINHVRCRTSFLRLPGRTLPLHRNLFGVLWKFDPDVIICEGESHFLGYLTALVYRWLARRRSRIIHWCFIALPGEPEGRRDLRALIKAITRRGFDAFLVYSSYSKQRLMMRDIPSSLIHVATNVGNVEQVLGRPRGDDDDKVAIRARLGYPDRFTVLYAGTLDPAKRPQLIIDIAAALPAVTFVVCGAGPEESAMRERIARDDIQNVLLKGNVGGEIVTHYRAADLLLVPGRGGIVMSEAMAASLPVIAHQADGTEYDLVTPGETGVLLEDGSASAFAAAIAELVRQPERVAKMGENSHVRIKHTFNTTAMVGAVIKAARQTARRRATSHHA